MTGMKKSLPAAALVMVMLLSLLAGCGQAPASASANAASAAKSAVQAQAYIDGAAVQDADISEEAVALDVMPAIFDLTPVASGRLVGRSGKASIDYSNTADGYVMAKFSAVSQKKIKAQVKGPSGTVYTYNLTAGASDWTTFPLSDGSGSYTVSVYENTSGTKYYTVVSVSFNVTLKDEFAPFLRPNQYVNYAANATKTIAKAAELTKGLTDPLDKVKAVYQFVVTTLTYDRAKAASVQSGYLPVLDTVLAAKTGICFDYAALMTAMLRSQGVPCKLVVGYVGNAYHAWISVWSAKTGWVNAAIYFDGNTWQRMDPTFASSAKQSAAIMQYIGDGSHYTAKYLY
jgi:hypothetical protein